ncbi:MAG: TlpA disulfide reductase family protein [Phycisphaerales bacterium]
MQRGIQSQWLGAGICVLLAAASAWGEIRTTLPQIPTPPMAPRFGPNVKFDPAGVPFELADVHGKAVLILFFQSWCPKCNAWSPKLLSQMEKAYEGDRSVILVAMKTDGGGVAGAKQYLKDHGADPSKWVVAADENAAYYMQVTGRNELWVYAFIDAQGRVMATMKAGAYYGDVYAPVKLKDSLLAQAKAKPLTGEQAYPSQLDKAVLAGEFGKFSIAAKLAQPMVRREGEVGDAAKRLVETVSQLGRQQTADAIKTLGDAGSEDRYDAYLRLKRLGNEFRGEDFGKEARDAGSKCRGEAWLKDEMAADQAFGVIQAKAAKLPEDQAKQLVDVYRQLAQRYPQTMYGRMAARLAGAMGG